MLAGYARAARGDPAPVRLAGDRPSPVPVKNDAAMAAYTSTRAALCQSAHQCGRGPGTGRRYLRQCQPPDRDHPVIVAGF
jgi:hypothetical protein